MSWQSASLPGSEPDSRNDLRRVRSRAWRAAIRALAADEALAKTRLASAGCSSNQLESWPLTVVSTSERIDALPSLVLVWPSNCGSRSFTEMMAMRPSRTSSPMRLSSFSFSRPLARAHLLSTLVSAFFRPSSCMPPSCVLMVLANE